MVKIGVRVTNVAEECVSACKTADTTLLLSLYRAQLQLLTKSINKRALVVSAGSPDTRVVVDPP